MDKFETESGFVISFTKLSKAEASNEIPEGTVVAYNGWEKELVIPSEYVYGKDSDGNPIMGKVTSIQTMAFENYIYMKRIEIPKEITFIGKYAFKNCMSLEYIAIHGEIKEIADYTFIGCKGLKSVSISSGVKSIGDYAFADCSSLTTLVIPESVGKIGYAAFSGCKALKTVTLSKNAKVDYMAFKDAPDEREFNQENKIPVF